MPSSASSSGTRRSRPPRSRRELVPPPQFEHASFESYRPDPDFPSQQAALDRLNEFAGAWRAAQRPGGFFSRKRPARIELPGVYLDGGFGVGKTHLLAALWHVAHGAEVLRHLHRVHGARRRARLRAGGRAAPRRSPRLHRRVRARRPGRHHAHDPVPRRAHGQRHARGRHLEHAAERARRGPVRRVRLPARDPRAVVELRDAAHRRARLPPARHRGPRRGARRRRCRRRTPPRHWPTRGHRVSLDGFDELIAHLATVHPSKYIKLIDGRRVHRPRGRARAVEPERRAAPRRLHRPRLRRRGADHRERRSRSTGCSTTR